MRHEGELAVQHRAGVRKALGSARMGATIPPVAEEFLRAQPAIVLGFSTDEEVWATVLFGPRGFVQAVDDRTVVIATVPGPRDPMAGHFTDEREVGLLAIEPATRDRIRVNGRARGRPQRARADRAGLQQLSQHPATRGTRGRPDPDRPRAGPVRGRPG